MKKRLLTIIGMLGIAVTLQATTYQFNPLSGYLRNLDDPSYYLWTIDLPLADGEVLDNATLTFSNLYGTDNQNGALSVFLINDINPRWSLENVRDSSPTPVSLRIYQFEDGGGDNIGQAIGNGFFGGTLVGSWSDADGAATKDTVTMELPRSTFQSYLENDTSWVFNFGLAFDPNGNFYNQGVQLSINTRAGSSVPDGGATAWLLGGAVMVLASIRRKLNR